MLNELEGIKVTVEAFDGGIIIDFPFGDTLLII
jgi:hypothetical protein